MPGNEESNDKCRNDLVVVTEVKLFPIHDCDRSIPPQPPHRKGHHCVAFSSFGKFKISSGNLSFRQRNVIKPYRKESNRTHTEKKAPKIAIALFIQFAGYETAGKNTRAGVTGSGQCISSNSPEAKRERGHYTQRKEMGLMFSSEIVIIA